MQEVYDWDLFSRDDLLGNAEFEIGSFVEAVRMKLKALPSGTIITKVHPSRTNDLSEESNVVWVNDEVVQTLFLRLRNVECGEVELELRWIDIPGSKGV
ncbi:Protein C2-DOMAIN ABA-RELATED 4 [Linum perenne]